MTTLQTKKTSPAYILILLFLIPPFAWYLMAKDKNYHIWLVFLMLLFSVIYGVTFISYAFFVLPKLAALSPEVGITNTAETVIPYSMIALCVFEFIFGIYLWKKIKKEGSLSKSTVILTVILLSISFLASIFSAGSIAHTTLLSIYTLETGY